jgi:magnesium transporter
MVDCGISADGQRLPGKYTHVGALTKLHELQHSGQQAFAQPYRPGRPSELL